MSLTQNALHTNSTCRWVKMCVKHERLYKTMTFFNSFVECWLFKAY